MASFPGKLGYDGTGKVKPFWILLEQEMMGRQWHQPDYMQIICTSLQTDNHASTSSLTDSSSTSTAERVLTMSQLQYLSYVTPRVRWYSSNGGSMRITSNLDSRSRRSNVSRSHFRYLQTPPPPQPLYDPVSGTTGVSRCQKRTSGLYAARED